MFERLMQHLGQERWIIAPDTPGFGASDPLPAPPSVPSWAEWIWTGLDAIGVDACDVFGHHTGAAIAVAMAAMHPERVNRVILWGPPLVDDAMKAVLRERIRPIPGTTDGAHLQGTWQRIAAKAADMPDWLLQRETLLTIEAGARAAEAYDAVFDYDFAGRLHDVTQPTLVIAGDRDTLCDAVYPTAARLPQGSAVMLADAGAYVCDLQPERVAAAIRQFLHEELVDFRPKPHPVA
ncbi:MAG: alpha/beta hydrolase [Anaerolineae bacterium]|nr:alpha/beta hydrolase [Anaerolineae bacterium]MCO5205044.1 alpha/beta hydrolase [Anaerolineae bacterium]